MLEYAFQGEERKLVHISEVETGKNCGCICPQCKDTLTAKNRVFNSRKKGFFFAHQNYEETRSCLMTQLHLAAQSFFLNQSSYTLPAVSFKYLHKTLTSPSKEINIKNAVLEFSLCKSRDYIADVKLETDIGIVLIEIAVTSKNKDGKNDYYIENKIPSLEYDLSKLIDLPVEEALREMVNNEALVKWTYEWNKETLINEHIAKVRQEQLNREKQAEKLKAEQYRLLKEEPEKNRGSAKRAINRILKNKSLKLPEIKEEFQYKHHIKEIKLILKQEISFNEIEVVYEEDKYFILEGIKFSKNGTKHSIYLIYIFSADYLPSVIENLNGAILIRIPKSIRNNNKNSFWKWHKNPRLNEIRTEKYSEFVRQCEIEQTNGLELRKYSKEIDYLSECYSKMNLQTYPKYQRWKTELIEKELFTPTENTPNPKYPYVLKYNKSHPQLWMFQEWYILVFMKLAEIVDQIKLFTLIDCEKVFDKLAEYFELHPRFNDFMNFTLSEHIQNPYFNKSLIIETSLLRFEPTSIRIRSGGIVRVEKLSLQLKC